MKNTFRASTLLLAILLVALSLASCSNSASGGDWAEAIYTEGKTLGQGQKTVIVEVVAFDKSVEFTIRTDAQYLGQVLLDNSLIEGEDGPYGLYIKRVNGILADYDIDGTYWAFYSNGEYMLSGVDTTEITDGQHYELIRQK